MTSSIDEYTEANYLYYLNDIKDFPVLTRAQEYDLMECIRQGDKDAYDYFYSCNLKWALKIAKMYQGRGCALMDLIQAGNEGLIRAMAKFNHTSGHKFSTYATPWIHQSVGRLLRQKGLIWIPEYLVMQIRKVKRIEMEMGTDATDERIAEAAKITVEHLHELCQWNMDTVSFDLLTNPDEEDDPLFLGSLIVDEDQTEKHQRSAEQSEMREAIEKALDKLTTKERAIIRLRFGLTDDERNHTLQEVSKVSRQRISQKEIVALQKLRPLLADVARRMGATA